MAGDIELNEMVKNGDLVEAESRFEGGAEGEGSHGDGKKWQDCYCVCCDALIGIVCFGVFLGNLSKNPLGYAPVFAANGLLLFTFIYLAVIRIVWSIIGCCFFCCPGCANTCRMPCRVVLGFITFILMCICLSEALYPEKLMLKMGGGIVGSALGALGNIGNLFGNALTSGATAFNSGGLSGLANAFGGSRRRLFLDAIAGAASSLIGGNPVVEFAGLARGLGLTTLVLYFLLPCICNTALLISLMTCKDSVLNMILKPENISTRVALNNVPFLLWFAGMVNKEAADEIRLDGGDKGAATVV